MANLLQNNSAFNWWLHKLNRLSIIRKSTSLHEKIINLLQTDIRKESFKLFLFIQGVYFRFFYVPPQSHYLRHVNSLTLFLKQKLPGFSLPAFDTSVAPSSAKGYYWLTGKTWASHGFCHCEALRFFCLARPFSWLELQPGIQYWHRPHSGCLGDGT